MTIFSVLAIAFYIYTLACHMKAKEFFWLKLPGAQKELVNYVGYKKVLFVKELPHAKKLCSFLDKRNAALREFDPVMAEKLIKAEKRLEISEFLLLPCVFFWMVQIIKVIK